MKRSSTAQSLASVKKTQTPFTALTRTGSAKKLYAPEIQTRKKPFFSEQKITKSEVTVEYFKWFHAQDHELAFQQKNEFEGKKKLHLQYFASLNR